MKETASERLERLLKDSTIIENTQASDYPIYYLYSILWNKPIDFDKIKFQQEDRDLANNRFLYTTSPRQRIFFNEDITILDSRFKTFLSTRQLEFFAIANLPLSVASLINDYELLVDKDSNKTIYVDWEKCFDYLCSLPCKHQCFFFPDNECFYYLEAKASYWKEWFTFSSPGKLAFLPLKKGRLHSNEVYQSLNNWYDFKHVYEIYYGDGANNRRRELLKALEPYCYLYEVVLRDVSFYLKDLDRQKNWKARLNKLNTFLKEHNLLKGYLAQYSVAEQLNILTVYSRVEKTHGKWAIGYLETQNKLLIDFEEIQSVLERAEIDWNKILIEPIELPEFSGGWQCIELITSSMLLEEGQYNNHCVGGYADVIENKDCRIFSFRKGTIRHTVQYYHAKYKKIWQIEQSCGKNNCDKISYSSVDAKYLRYNELLLLTHLIEKYKDTSETNDFL